MENYNRVCSIPLQKSRVTALTDSCQWEAAVMSDRSTKNAELKGSIPPLLLLIRAVRAVSSL